MRGAIVHSPGSELSAVTPSNRADYLYDDIIDAEAAQREHRRFIAILERFTPVYQVRSLLADILETGVRREEAPTRANTPVLGWDDTHQMVKVNPLATWTAADVEAYQVEHNLPRNPLSLQGFPSIGCEPCTARVAPGADPRSGRWAGRDKIECGIHL